MKDLLQWLLVTLVAIPAIVLLFKYLGYCMVLFGVIDSM